MTQKAKRRLTDISFDHEGAHVALVGKFQGGPANGMTTLITKATDDISEEALDKAMSSIHEGESTVETPSIETEEIMQEEIQKAVAAAEETLKAQFKVELESKEMELQKALELVAQFQQKEKDVVVKQRKEAIASVEPDAEKAEVLFKSLETLDSESFEAVIKALKDKSKLVEETDLFVQKSKQMEVEEPVGENATAVLLKQKYAKQ